MSDRRVFRWATTSARLLAGTLVAIGFVVAVVTAVSRAVADARARTGRDRRRRRRPAASVLVCTGGLLALGPRARGRRTRRRRLHRRP